MQTLKGTIGHNNPPPTMAERFAAIIERMKGLGLKGEVAVTSGVVMFSTTDKASASLARKGIKNAAKKAGAVSVETRPAKGAYVFTILTNEES